jgi:two-component system OmpR family response regulator/two-component system response regulator CpxR
MHAMRILLIDDDERLLALLNEYLLEEGFLVHAATDASQGVLEALSGSYALVVLDVMMPRLNGLDVLRQVRQRSNVPVLMLTARGDEVDRITGFELGADDYVAKPCTPRELVARIRAILRRTRLGAADAGAGPVTSGHLAIWPAQRRAEWQGAPVQLTSTEFSLLEVLLRSVGTPVSKNDLALRAMGRPHARHDRSIDVHISSIRKKLGTTADGRPLIQAVHQQGYQLLKD